MRRHMSILAVGASPVALKRAYNAAVIDGEGLAGQPEPLMAELDGAGR